MGCYVYIMQSGRRKGSPIKIGVADNPQKRLDDLQTGNPEPIILVAKILMVNRAAAYNLESWLHRRFASANIGGEWFNSRKCNLKKAFGVWNDMSVSKIAPETIRKSSRHNQLEIENESLRHANIRLKKRIKELERDMEEYLDDNFKY